MIFTRSYSPGLNGLWVFLSTSSFSRLRNTPAAAGKRTVSVPISRHVVENDKQEILLTFVNATAGELPHHVKWGFDCFAKELLSPMTDPNEQLVCIVGIVSRIGEISGIQPDQDFYDAGFVSVNALPLLMELEDRFGITIPDEQYINARTPRALNELVASLQTSLQQ
jgi:acyl carrier protein